jgi:hypothetical protein
VISAAENSNKFPKTRFWKEKSVEDIVTLECLPFNSGRRNCDVPLVLLERSRWFRFNGIYVVRFGLGMWEIWNFQWFLSLKIQVIFIKTRFWKEKSVENMVTLKGLPFSSSMISFHIWLFKKLIHTWQNNIHMLSFPIL